MNFVQNMPKLIKGIEKNECSYKQINNKYFPYWDLAGFVFYTLFIVKFKEEGTHFKPSFEKNILCPFD